MTRADFNTILRELFLYRRVPAIFSRTLGLTCSNNPREVVSSGVWSNNRGWRTSSKFLPLKSTSDSHGIGFLGVVTFVVKFSEEAEIGSFKMVRKKKRYSDQFEEDVRGPDNGADQSDLYKVLGVDQTATQDEIRKAYHKLALRLHPDKNPDDESSKEKFQSLQSVIAILGDPEKRKVYDETGSVEDVELSGDSFKNVYQFFRSLYKQITEEDIDSYAESYRGSEEEKADLKTEYSRHKGNMERVFTYLMCSDPKLDSHRFMEIIDSSISCGELKEFKVYRKWAEGASKLPAPSNPLAPPIRKKKSKDFVEGPLAIIAKRSRGHMESLVSALEAKYGGKGKGKKDSRLMADEPSEEEFKAAQARMMGSQKRSSSRSTESRKNNKRKSGKLD